MEAIVCIYLIAYSHNTTTISSHNEAILNHTVHAMKCHFSSTRLQNEPSGKPQR